MIWSLGIYCCTNDLLIWSTNSVKLIRSPGTRSKSRSIVAVVSKSCQLNFCHLLAKFVKGPCFDIIVSIKQPQLLKPNECVIKNAITQKSHSNHNFSILTSWDNLLTMWLFMWGWLSISMCLATSLLSTTFPSLTWRRQRASSVAFTKCWHVVKALFCQRNASKWWI